MNSLETDHCIVLTRAAKSKEDAYWASQGDGQMSKAQKKKQEQEAKRREAAQKKEEARKLLAAEEASIDKPKKPQKASVAQKVSSSRHCVLLL